MRRWWIRRILGAIIFVTLGILAFGWIITLLWNQVVPPLFNGPVITFGQAMALFVLSRLLLGGFRFGGWGGGWGHWRRRKFEERMARMTPEEREKFRQTYYQRCGPWHSDRSRRDEAVPQTNIVQE